MGNSIGPVLVREGEGIQGKGSENWMTPPIPLDDYTDDKTGRSLGPELIEEESD